VLQTSTIPPGGKAADATSTRLIQNAGMLNPRPAAGDPLSGPLKQLKAGYGIIGCETSPTTAPITARETRDFVMVYAGVEGKADYRP